MKQRILSFALLLIGTVSLVQLQPALASNQVPDSSKDPLGINYGQYSGLSNQDPRMGVVRMIKFVLGFLGLVFIILTIYAGFLWMTSAGNEDQVTKAKKILWGAVVGTIVIFFSYAITEFVLTNSLEAVSNKPYTTP